MRRIALQFLPQPQDVVVHRSSTGVVLVTPHFIEKFVSRDHALWVLCQELQRLEFLCSDHDLLAAASDLGLGKINDHILKDVQAFRTDP